MRKVHRVCQIGVARLTLLCLLAWTLTSGGAESSPSPRLDSELGRLVARSAHPASWPSLRRYAQRVREPETRGEAYFLLGYREYEAQRYAAAATDLDQARATGFSLADFAAYYAADAAEKAGQPGQAVKVLAEFTRLYPSSTLRSQAVELNARALLETGQPQAAVDLLAAWPELHHRAPLLLLLAQGYEKQEKWELEARLDQELYFEFPLSLEAQEAGRRLRALQAILGSRLPAASWQMQEDRARILFQAGRYQDAAAQYEVMLAASPSHPQAAAWQVRRARCLVRLKRASEAVRVLQQGLPENPAADAERLSVLVEAESELNNQRALFEAVDELAQRYPRSPAYAAALFTAGNFLLRQDDWIAAGRYYRSLADGFPRAQEAAEADWRAAWASYLAATRASLSLPSATAQSSLLEEAVRELTNHILRYPESPHVPAALYWLGRLAERRHASAEAVTYYRLLQDRFPHHFCALQAAARLRALPAELSGGTSLATRIPPPPSPPSVLCRPGSSALLAPFWTLERLGLEDLAARYLRSVLRERPGEPEVLFALCRLEARRGNHSAALLDARRLLPHFVDYPLAALPQEAWDLLYPREYWTLVQRQARANGLDPYLVMGLIRQESAFNPRARSPAGARGLMQVLPETASAHLRGRRRRAATARLEDPGYNIRAGCRYLRALLRAFHGDTGEALAAYNAGDFRVRDWFKQGPFAEPAEFVESIPFSETRIYVESVLRDAGIYRSLLGGAARFNSCAVVTGK